MKEMNNDFMTDFSLELANLHMAGYKEGWNDKTVAIATVHKEGNNPLLRVEAVNSYLEGLKAKQTYEAETDRIIARITNLIFEYANEKEA